MSSTTLVNALALPAEARVDQRVPKKLLLEQVRQPPPTSGIYKTASRRWSGSRP